MAELKRSLVWGVDSEAYIGQGGLLRGLDEILDLSPRRELCGYKENVAVKVDVGELGNIRYLRPVIVQSIGRLPGRRGSPMSLTAAMLMTLGIIAPA